MSKTFLRSMLTLPAVAMLLAASVAPVEAKSVLFSFNPTTLPSPYNKTPYNKPFTNNTSAPSTGADDSSAVQTYMDEMLSTVEPKGSTWGVTVKGAETSGLPGGTIADAGYTGDSHVVCKGSTSGSSCVPDTLATQYNTPFLITDGTFAVNGDNAIQMQLTGGIAVTSISFDFEIFPDAGCANGNSGCTVPDFTFTMLNGTKTVVSETVDALLPGKTSTPINKTVATGITYQESGGASATTNKNSELTNPELADQYMGVMTFTFATPVTDPTLQFIDWPDAVAITNVNLGYYGTPTPASLLIVASGLLGLLFAQRKFKRS